MKCDVSGAWLPRKSRIAPDGWKASEAGVNGGCIICHGSSEARTIRAAVRAAREYVAAGVNDAIVERVTAIDEHASSVEAASA